MANIFRVLLRCLIVTTIWTMYLK